MGDVAMTVPVLRALVNQHPNIKITFVSKPFLAPLFDTIPNVTFYDAEVKNRHKGILGLFRLYKELKLLDITYIADLHDVLRSKILRTYFKLSGYKIAVINKGRAEKKALTRTVNKVFKPLKTSHQRYADVFEKLGFSVDLSNVIPIPKPELSQNILTITGKKNRKWIGIAPFAAFNSKKYPLKLMEDVIFSLTYKEVDIFLFGGGEKEIAILNGWERNYQNTKNIAGTLSLRDELMLIAHLDIMVSMDSGNAHFSATQDVKTITIWGVTHPFAGFAPFNQPKEYAILPDLKKYPNIPCSVYGNKVCKGYENVMESIQPSEIVSKIEMILNH
ncbi:MAG: ADP-heptose--LPS heptosyltransferase RfaF [Flavobacteriaceae bacterium]|nr:MAG: ADP-heptose--LPS heptosyltransferase RfaF [Flavobacteriaceae bacterium]